jgi:2-methylcitrate dehydratase PrpD
LSFTQAAGSYVNLGVDAHYLDTAWACRNGYIAAEMAGMGFTGGTNMEKWLTTLLGEDGVKLEEITANIGTPPFFIHNIWTKKYPCCFLTHRHTDSLFVLIKEHGFTAPDIAEITLDAGAADADICNRPDPADIESSKFSYQHILSAVLLDGDLDMDTFTDKKIGDPAFKELRSKIKVVAHPEWGAGTQAGIAKTTVKLKDGTVLVKEMDQPPGGSKYPLTTEQVVQLYRKYTRNILTKEDISRTADMIQQMEDIDDLTDFIHILTFRQ